MSENIRDTLNRIFAGRDSGWVKQLQESLDKLHLPRQTALWANEAKWAVVLMQRQKPGEGFDLGNFSVSGSVLSRLIDAEAERGATCYLATVESLTDSSEILSYARVNEVVGRINAAGVDPFTNRDGDEYYWFDRDLQPLVFGERSRFRGTKEPPEFLIF